MNDELSQWKFFSNWWRLGLTNAVLLKVITVKNIQFISISFLIMGSNFKILYVMVTIIWQCCVLI